MARLSDFSARAAGLLEDPAHLIYSPAQVENALRQALAEYNLAAGGPAQTIADLDGAAATSLPPLHEALIAAGAAGYAASARCARREQIPAGLADWANNELASFRAGLEQVRTAGLRGASAPWAQSGWPFTR
jgi:hypothetical protein